MPETKTTNRLIHETSPYLLQHSHNPVDWYPWGDEAFAKAKQEDKPILLSCGYSACHWCHVMERECFEDEAIAELMNRNYINIKVDREERPDIDQIYQQAVQIMTGQGGWPLTVFLDHERRPFFGGTYFPPTPMYGRMSFPELLQTIHQKWLSERTKIGEASQELIQFINARAELAHNTQESVLPKADLPVKVIDELSGIIDRRYGGFNEAPKFPTPNLLTLFLRAGSSHHKKAETELVLFTLRQMARGGIYDQIGGGFHRYATDARWLVPHFEKMLYDNAQLLKVYTLAFQLTGELVFKDIIQATAEYIRREMTAPEGGFFATQDADSDGEEGKYYVWSTAEVKELLDLELAQLIIEYYQMTPEGNFEGENILNRLEQVDGVDNLLPETRSKLQQAKTILLAAREKRIKPFRDEKIITSWNGLMIGAYAYLYQVLANPLDYRSAKKAAEFIVNSVKLADGNLARIYKDGNAKINAFLDDYAFMASGLIDLYEADFNPTWLEQSLNLTKEACRLFSNGNGCYYLTALTGEELAGRPLSGIDQAIPGGVGVHVENLMRLAVFSGETDLNKEVERIFEAYSSQMAQNNWSYATLISALDIYYQHFKEFTFISEGSALPELLTKLRKYMIPYRIMAWNNNTNTSNQLYANHPARGLLTDRDTLNGQTTCYVCSDCRCLPPVTEWEDLQSMLDQLI